MDITMKIRRQELLWSNCTRIEVPEYGISMNYKYKICIVDFVLECYERKYVVCKLSSQNILHVKIRFSYSVEK